MCHKLFKRISSGIGNQVHEVGMTEALVKILFIGPKDCGKSALANFISGAVQVPMPTDG